MSENSKVFKPHFASNEEQISYLKRKVDFLTSHAETIAHEQIALANRQSRELKQDLAARERDLWQQGIEMEKRGQELDQARSQLRGYRELYFPQDQTAASGGSPISMGASEKREFVHLFSHVAIANTTYPAKCKLFNETEFYVDLGDVVGREIFVNGFIEPDVSRYFHNHIKPGDLFIDCHAHMGYYSQIAAAKMGDEGTILAFETNRAVSELLLLNHQDTINLRLIEKNISGYMSRINFDRYTEKYSPKKPLKGTNKVNSELEIDGIEIESTTIRQVLVENTHQSTGNIWIRIENLGDHMTAIESSIDAIVARDCRVVFSGEFNSSYDRRILDVFADLGLSIYLFDALGLIEIEPDTELPRNTCLYFIAGRSLPAG